MYEITYRMMAVACCALMWCATGVVCAQSSDHTINQNDIAISLPVFVTSVIGTAVFTWTVAKYDTSRSKRIDRIERRLEELMQSREAAEFGDSRRSQGGNDD